MSPFGYGHRNLRGRKESIMKAFLTSIIATVAVAILLTMETNITLAAQPATKPVLTGIVYTADEIGNSISAIDLASGKVQIVPVPISPHNVQITGDGTWLLAVGELATDGNPSLRQVNRPRRDD